MPIRLVRVLLLACLLLTACRSGGTGAQPTPTAARPPSAPAATVAAPPATAAPPASQINPTTPPPAAKPTSPSSPVAVMPAASPASSSPVACKYAPSQRLAEAQDRGIKEASALVASQRWPGVYWTLNDSGNSPNLFALDEKGANRGSFRVEDADNEDWEALALGPGEDGSPALYIGDIGDNDRKRKEIVVYRVPEPEPSGAGARNNSGRIDNTETFTFSYPNGVHDAEALLVHPKTGEMLIVTKDSLGRATVYRAPQPLDGRKKMTLEHVGNLDMTSHGIKVDIVDDGTVAADASRVTIRTYGSALEYDVPPNAQLASIWKQSPRMFKLDDGPQSEGITYRADGKALISIGEGTPAAMYQTLWQCG